MTTATFDRICHGPQGSRYMIERSGTRNVLFCPNASSAEHALQKWVSERKPIVLAITNQADRISATVEMQGQQVDVTVYCVNPEWKVWREGDPKSWVPLSEDAIRIGSLTNDDDDDFEPSANWSTER